MSKQGMKRPEYTHIKERNTVSPVPEIQGRAKHGHIQANPIVAGTAGAEQKVYHSTPHSPKNRAEKPVSSVYPVIDNDLARDNVENDMTAADLQDL